MRNVLVAALVSLIVSLLGTPFAIRLFRARGYGQLIRDDGPTTHQTKRGTPTMGGTVIIFATLLGYVGAHIVPLRGFKCRIQHHPLQYACRLRSLGLVELHTGTHQ